jgi:hypothetical protein
LVPGIPTQSITIYVRQESMKLWSKLEELEGSTHRLIIQGSPGIGKSTELYGWLQFKRRSHRVIYLFDNKELGHEIWLCDDSKIAKYTFASNCPIKIVQHQLTDLYKTFQPSIVVCDGYTKESNMLMFLCNYLYFQCAVVYCSSYKAAADIKSRTHEALIRNNSSCDVANMDSWSLHEYYAAFDKGIFDNINSKQDLLARYYYGGGSIRLMLMNIDRIIVVIETALCRAPNAGQLMSCLYGQGNDSITNSLFQSFGNHHQLLSEYVVKRVTNIVDQEFINNAKCILSYNPSFQGWIFELEVISMIRKKSILLTDSNHPWNSHTSLIDFTDNNDSNLLNIQPNTLLIPREYNHGLFDIMLYVQPGLIRVANITMAKFHLFDLEMVIPYLERFKDHSSGKCFLVFDIIIPLSNQNVYSVNINHFQWKHRIHKYDSRWHRYASVSQICNVLLMDRDHTHSAVRYEFNESAHGIISCSYPNLRKRGHVDVNEEDENELFDEKDQVEFY